MATIKEFNVAVKKTVAEIEKLLNSRKRGSRVGNCVTTSYFEITNFDRVFGVELLKNSTYHSFKLYCSLYSSKGDTITFNVTKSNGNPFTSVRAHKLYGAGTHGVTIQLVDIFSIGSNKTYLKNICNNGSVYPRTSSNAINVTNVTYDVESYKFIIHGVGLTEVEHQTHVLNNIKQFFESPTPADVSMNLFKIHGNYICFDFCPIVNAQQGFNTKAEHYLPTALLKTVYVDVYDNANQVKVKCYKFSADELKSAILYHIDHSIFVGHKIFYQVPTWVRTFFKNTQHNVKEVKFTDTKISPLLAQYFVAGFGELASAYMLAKYPNTFFTPAIKQAAQFTKSVRPADIEILFPTDSSFQIIDFILLLHKPSNVVYKLRFSVKYGHGAAPSVIGFLDECFKTKSKFNSPKYIRLKELLNYRNSHPHTSFADMLIEFYSKDIRFKPIELLKYRAKLPNSYQKSIPADKINEKNIESTFSQCANTINVAPQFLNDNEKESRIYIRTLTTRYFCKKLYDLFSETNGTLPTFYRELCDALPFFQLHFDKKIAQSGKLYFHPPVLVNDVVKFEIFEQDCLPKIKFVTHDTQETFESE